MAELLCHFLSIFFYLRAVPAHVGARGTIGSLASNWSRPMSYQRLKNSWYYSISHLKTHWICLIRIALVYDYEKFLANPLKSFKVLPVTYSKVWSERTSIIGHTTALLYFKEAFIHLILDKCSISLWKNNASSFKIKIYFVIFFYFNDVVSKQGHFSSH